MKVWLFVVLTGSAELDADSESFFLSSSDNKRIYGFILLMANLNYTHHNITGYILVSYIRYGGAWGEHASL